MELTYGTVYCARPDTHLTLLTEIKAANKLGGKWTTSTNEQEQRPARVETPTMTTIPVNTSLERDLYQPSGIYIPNTMNSLFETE